MTGTKERKPTSGLKIKVGSEGSHVTLHAVETAPNKLSEVNTFRSDENNGNLDAQPLLVVGHVDIDSGGEDLQGSSGLSRQTRTKAPSKTLNEEVNAEKALHAKC